MKVKGSVGSLNEERVKADGAEGWTINNGQWIIDNGEYYLLYEDRPVIAGY